LAGRAILACNTETLCSQRDLEGFGRRAGMMFLGHKLRQLALIVVTAASVTSCGLLSGGPKTETWGSGNLRMTLWVSRSLPRVGEPVEIRYTVENPTDQTEVIQLEDKPVMDILILFGPGGHITNIYWSDGREITPEMRRLELAPGQSKTIEMTWVADKKAEGGPVSVHGILNWAQMYSSYVPVMICVGKCPVY